MRFPPREGLKVVMGIRGVRPSPLGCVEILIPNSGHHRWPSARHLPVTQRGWRCLHTTRHLYRPGSQTPQGSQEFGKGSEQGSSQSSQRATTHTAWKLLRRTVQGILLLLAFNITSDATGLSTTILSWVRGRPLNQDSFVPFTIVSKEQISPTAFILTVRPKHSGPPSRLTTFFLATHADSPAALLDDPVPRFRFYWPLFLRLTHSSGPAISAARSHGLWSVEVRQPQLQVAREYTPLPPLSPSEGAESDDDDDGSLRFLVRRLAGGEVSSYLAGLRVGDDVDLRGPHLGYDVRARLGGGSSGGGGRVVFLAGGTGVAPALQVASALLDGDGDGDAKPTVSIVWANRQRADCEGCDGDGAGEGKLDGVNGRSAIVAQLADMQARHPDKLTVRCAVDEERTFITAADVTRAASSASSSPTSASPECRLHAQKWVAARPAREVPGEECACATPGDNNKNKKNLLFVSGPDGFVEAYAGPKRWAGGHELQGPVSGLLGRLRRQDPEFWRDWLVLKL